MKHDPKYNAAIEKALEDFYRPDGLEMSKKCPYLFSSNMADAYYITAYALYHSGHTPRSLHKSHGYKWIVDIFGLGEIKVKVDRPDHREGITIL